MVYYKLPKFNKIKNMLKRWFLYKKSAAYHLNCSKKFFLSEFKVSAKKWSLIWVLKQLKSLGFHDGIQMWKQNAKLNVEISIISILKRMSKNFWPIKRTLRWKLLATDRMAKFAVHVNMTYLKLAFSTNAIAFQKRSWFLLLLIKTLKPTCTYENHQRLTNFKT